MLTSKSKLYTLKLTIDNNLNFEFAFEEINEKVSYLKKFISNFVGQPSEVTKVFALNPFNYARYSKSNKKNNILFLLDDNFIKKLEIDITHKGVHPEVNIINNTLVNISSKYQKFNI